MKNDDKMPDKEKVNITIKLPIVSHQQPDPETCGSTVVRSMVEGYIRKDLADKIKRFENDKANFFNGRGTTIGPLANLIQEINNENKVLRDIIVYGNTNEVDELTRAENAKRNDKIKRQPELVYTSLKRSGNDKSKVKFLSGDGLTLDEIIQRVEDRSYVIFNVPGHWVLAYGVVHVPIGNNYEKRLLIMDPASVTDINGKPLDLESADYIKLTYRNYISADPACKYYAIEVLSGSRTLERYLRNVKR